MKRSKEIDGTMKEKIIMDIRGKIKKIECLGCAREEGKINSGNIVKSTYFDAHQDYEIPIPSFVIVSSRRHIQSIDEFTEAEKIDFIKFLCHIRRGMRKILKLSIVYLIQEEDTSHHFHVLIFPRYNWMDEKFGRKIQSVRPIMDYAREKLKTNDNIKRVEVATRKLKQYLKEIRTKNL